MNLKDSLKTALRNIRSNKRRAFLTMLGVIIGITSVIIVMSAGAGAQSLITNQIEVVGSNLIAIFPGKAEESGPPVSVMGVTVTSLKNEDIEALRNKSRLPYLIAAAPYVRGVGTMLWRERSIEGTFVGTTSDYMEIENGIVGEGRFLNREEEAGLAKVAVIGSKIKEDLFRGEDAVGQRLKIKKENFEVIGVMEEKGVSGFTNVDNLVFIPVKTAQKLLLGINHISFARSKVNSAENISSTMEDIKMVLRERHNIDRVEDDDFTVRSQKDMLNTFTRITDSVKLFLVAIASIALLVGGIGIMNIMLVSVTERTHEVGLRMAVGAKKLDILGQFVVEAIVITFIGGIFGIAIGAGLSGLISGIINYLGYDWDYVITLSSVLLAGGVSVLIGLIFGIYPARKAAYLDPVEALRYE